MIMPIYTATVWRRGKSVFLSDSEAEMLTKLVSVTNSPSSSDCIRLLISSELTMIQNNEQSSEFVSVKEKMTGRHSYRLSENEQKQLSDLCAFFGNNESAVIRHLIRKYYAEYQQQDEANND